MNVLMISGDRHLLEVGSPAYERLALQKSQVDELAVYVWPHVHHLGEVLHAAQTKHYDVVTAQDPFWRGLIAWGMARWTHTKLNIQVHTDLDALSLFRRLFSRWVLRRADTVRVVSSRIQRQVEHFGVRVPIRVLPVYVDLAPFQGLEHHAHPRFEKTILWVGRFEQEKNPQEAIRILSAVRAEGINAGLIFLGAGSLESSLRVQAESLVAAVEFPGWQDPAPFLAMADVVLSTSLHESYGLSTIEALAAGVPVVAPDIGIAREAGARVVPRKELATAVANVLRSEDRGRLRLSMPHAQEWVHLWRKSLI